MIKTSKTICISILLAAVLILTSAGLVCAKTTVAPSPDSGTNYHEPMSEERENKAAGAVFDNYCCIIKDVKLTTLQRASTKAKLEKQLVNALKKKGVTKFLHYGGHEDASDVADITGIQDKSLAKVLNTSLSGGYKVIPIKAEVRVEGQAGVAGTHVILVHAQKEATQNEGGSDGKNGDSEADGGTAAEDGAAAAANHAKKKSAKKENTKKATARIAEKNRQGYGAGPAESAESKETRKPGRDLAAIVLASADAAAALAFAGWIVPDLMVIRWFRRKQKASRRRREER